MTDRLPIPELGPSFGRLIDPPTESPKGSLAVPLDDLRLDLVTRLFELAGAGRQFAAAGDRHGALTSLSRAAWLSVWEQTVAAAAARVSDAVNRTVRAAAVESRFPAKKLPRVLLAPDDAHAIAARLGSGGAAFVAALDALEAAVPAAAAVGERGTAGWEAWRAALGAVARRLESAWLALEEAAVAEQARWQPDIERVRAWRRPAWPLWLITVLIVGVMTYVGLVFGGYLPWI